MAKRPEVYELLENVEKAKSRKEKIKLLQKYRQYQAFFDVLVGSFDDRIQWKLPEGAPPFEEPDPTAVPSTLHRQHRQLKYFVAGQPAAESMSTIRRERLFIDLLESVHPQDAHVLINMKDKKQPAKGLTKKLFKEAFPNLIPN